jgi:hypothetical protein
VSIEVTKAPGGRGTVPQANRDGRAGGEVGEDDRVEVVDLLLQLFHVGRHLMDSVPVLGTSTV